MEDFKFSTLEYKRPDFEKTGAFAEEITEKIKNAASYGELKGYMEQMEEMEENVYLSKFHAQKGHLEQLAELDNRFHDILYEACDSKMLEHQLKDFHQYVLRVRKKTLASANRGPKSNEEHEQIMEAIKAGNADLAEQLAHQHMINAYDNMVKNGLNEAYAQQDKPQE